MVINFKNFKIGMCGLMVVVMMVVVMSFLMFIFNSVFIFFIMDIWKWIRK